MTRRPTDEVSDTMNVLLFAPFSLGEPGGVATFVTRLQASLNECGHRALVLEPGQEHGIAPASDGRPLTYTIRLRPMYVSRAPLRSFVAFLAFLPRTLFDLHTFLRRERIDVVHLNFPVPLALYFTLLRPVSSWRLVLTCHGSDIYRLPSRTPLYRRLFAAVLRCADAITTVSTDLLRSLQAAFPRLRAPGMVIPNASPTLSGGAPRRSDARETDSRSGYVLSVGNLIPRKGHDVFLRALSLVRERGHHPRVVIVGDGEEARSLSRLAKDLSVEDLVAFAGGLPHRDVLALYEPAKYVVLASRKEGLPLVVLEAMAARKAVIATRVGGVPEVVHDGETGLLVDPDDPEGLARAILRLEEDDALRLTLAERGYRHVCQEYSWTRLTERYLEVYEALVPTT